MSITVDVGNVVMVNIHLIAVMNSFRFVLYRCEVRSVGYQMFLRSKFLDPNLNIL